MLPKLIKQLAQELNIPSSRVIDIHAVLSGPYNEKKSFSKDGVHPNDKGYSVIAHVVENALVADKEPANTDPLPD